MPYLREFWDPPPTTERAVALPSAAASRPSIEQAPALPRNFRFLLENGKLEITFGEGSKKTGGAKETALVKEKDKEPVKENRFSGLNMEKATALATSHSSARAPFNSVFPPAANPEATFGASAARVSTAAVRPLLDAPPVVHVRQSSSLRGVVPAPGSTQHAPDRPPAFSYYRLVSETETVLSTQDWSALYLRRRADPWAQNVAENPSRATLEQGERNATSRQLCRRDKCNRNARRCPEKKLCKKRKYETGDEARSDACQVAGSGQTPPQLALERPATAGQDAQGYNIPRPKCNRPSSPGWEKFAQEHAAVAFEPVCDDIE